MSDPDEAPEEEAPRAPSPGAAQLWPAALALLLVGPVLVRATGLAAIGYLAWLGAAGLALAAAIRGRGASVEQAFEDDGAPLPHPVAGRRALLALGAGAAAAGVFGLLRSARDDTSPAWPWWFIGVGCLAFAAGAIFTAVVAAQPRGAAVLNAPPRAKAARAWIGVATCALITAQALIPMGYYMGDDIYDERFSWRMFSAVRVARCQLSAEETRRGEARRQTPLMRTVHVAWVNTMKRNREAVLRRYLRWRCEEEPELESARVTNRCTSPEGNALPDVVRQIDCASGAIDEGAEP